MPRRSRRTWPGAGAYVVIKKKRRRTYGSPFVCEVGRHPEYSSTTGSFCFVGLFCLGLVGLDFFVEVPQQHIVFLFAFLDFLVIREHYHLSITPGNKNAMVRRDQIMH